MRDHFFDKIDNHMTLGRPDAGENVELLECPRCKNNFYDLIPREMSIIALVKSNTRVPHFSESFCEECIKLMSNYFRCENCGEEFVEQGIADHCPSCQCKELYGDSSEMTELISKTNKGK